LLDGPAAGITTKITCGMPECRECGAALRRTHRTALQKVIFRETFKCPRCLRRDKLLYLILEGPSRWFQSARSFYLSRYTSCIRCGNVDVRRVAKLDLVGSQSKHVWSLLFRLAGAPLNKCDACRLQYYDWRVPRRIKHTS
jgi:hypothetical protein